MVKLDVYVWLPDLLFYNVKGYFQFVLQYLNGDVKEKDYIGLEIEIANGKQTLMGLKIIIWFFFIACISQTSLNCLFIPKCELSTLIGLVVKEIHFDTKQIKHLLTKRKFFQMILVYFITFG